MISNEAFEKAISTSAESKIVEAVEPASSSPTPESVAPKSDQLVTQPVIKSEEQPEWDGDVNKLPPELQTWAKKAQRHLTKKAMADSELRNMGQEFQQFQSSEDWRSFQSWKQNRGQVVSQPITPTQSPQAQPLVSQQEWEEAQLDPMKFNGLVDRLVSDKINQAAQMYGQELQQLRSTQQVTQFQNVLADFAEVNPNVLELHELGIMKPLLEEEMRGGKHKSYESMVNSAYERANQIHDTMKAKALQASQGRVLEKKGAVINTGTTSAEADVVYADKGRTFDEALNQALQGKKVKVKAK